MAGFCIALCVMAGFMYQKMNELTNQLAYLQDSTSVIVSEMGGLQANIEKTLQEEASMIEDYSITVNSLDFGQKTYRVDVSVVPKEYTDKTEVSIYFGTLECPLKQGRYAYTGTANLPIDKNFDGNITFLLSNGRKKATEVLSDYQGLQLNLDQVLSASLSDAPSYRNGAIRLDSECSVTLDGGERFMFEKLDMVTLVDDKRVDILDLMTPLTMSEEDKKSADSDVDREDGTEAMSTASIVSPTVDSLSGEVECKLAYAIPEEGTEDEEESEEPRKHHIRVVVRARTTEGYRFENTVFEGDYLVEDQTMDKESFQWNTRSVAYDRNGNELILQ